VTDEHAVEVVGYAESGLRDGAGGSTRFVVGECTDLLIRVTTTSAGGSPITWSIDDGGHNGPWTFESPGEAGVHEYPSCSFDNDFTLTRQAGSSWQGTVEVVGFIHYHNTITIPTDENWIVQGAIDPDTGLPASLDGRLSSGSKADRSRASIVLRQVRISGQLAPVDLDGRPGHPEGGTVAGAFYYDGGSGDPSNPVKIMFIDSVFDHNQAGALGGAVVIDGRGGMPLGDPPVQNWDSAIALTVERCTFYANFCGLWVAALAVLNAWPLTSVVRDTDYIHNQ